MGCEVGLGVVIDRRGQQVDEASALQYVAGYCTRLGRQRQRVVPAR